MDKYRIVFNAMMSRRKVTLCPTSKMFVCKIPALFILMTLFVVDTKPFSRFYRFGHAGPNVGKLLFVADDASSVTEMNDRKVVHIYFLKRFEVNSRDTNCQDEKDCQKSFYEFQPDLRQDEINPLIQNESKRDAYNTTRTLGLRLNTIPGTVKWSPTGLDYASSSENSQPSTPLPCDSISNERRRRNVVPRKHLTLRRDYRRK